MRKRCDDPPGMRLETKLLLSVDEAATLMSLGRSIVYDLVMRQQIASIKVGRMRRIPVSALREYVQKRLAEEGLGA
jgi:excisionase family DNA binding protein